MMVLSAQLYLCILNYVSFDGMNKRNLSSSNIINSKTRSDTLRFNFRVLYLYYIFRSSSWYVFYIPLFNISPMVFFYTPYWLMFER